MTIPELITQARLAADAEPVDRWRHAVLRSSEIANRIVDEIERAWRRESISDTTAREMLEDAIAASCYAAEHPADDRLPDTEELGLRSMWSEP